MKKIFNDVISFAFIALMVLVLISGLSVLLGFEKPGNIEGGDHHDMTGYAYGKWAATTIITLAMWPVLVVMYYRLAKKEEKEALEAFDEGYEDYKLHTPMFFPSMKRILTPQAVS